MGNLLPSILLVEDDDVDVEVIRRAFTKRHIVNPLIVAPDGEAALNVLHGKAGESPLQSPYVILLDLNLPRMGGLEFLNTLRHDDALKDSIVFVLTTSNSDRDRTAANAHNIAGYLLKSETDDDCSQLLRDLRPVLRYADE